MKRRDQPAFCDVLVVVGCCIGVAVIITIDLVQSGTFDKAFASEPVRIVRHAP